MTKGAGGGRLGGGFVDALDREAARGRPDLLRHEVQEARLGGTTLGPL